MSEINIYIAENDISLGSTDYLGFFGEQGFGDPMSLGEFNSRTFITNSTGGIEGAECDNTKLTVAGGLSGVGGVSGVIVGQTGNGILLTALPNYLATMNVRFTHPEIVIVQNAQMIVYDGSNIATPPTGLSVYGAEVIHTAREQTDTGLGDNVWTLLGGSGTPLFLVESPATSGFSPAGPGSLDTRHDWYVAMSMAPTTPGNKTFKFRFDLEFV